MSEWVNFKNKNSPSLSFSFWSCWALWKITLYYHSWTIIHFLELLGNPRFACEEVKNCGCSSTKILLAHHSLTELIMPTIIQLSRFCRTLYKWNCGLISWKKGSKSGLFLDPFWGFALKTVLGIHNPRISWLLFGTKNHKMRGPPVQQKYFKQRQHRFAVKLKRCTSNDWTIIWRRLQIIAKCNMTKQRKETKWSGLKIVCFEILYRLAEGFAIKSARSQAVMLKRSIIFQRLCTRVLKE